MRTAHAPRNRPVLLLLPLLCACHAARPSARDLRAHASELAQRFVIVDGHVDVPYRLEEQAKAGPVDDVGLATVGGDFDWPRARAGGLDAPFMSIYTPAEDEEAGRARVVADGLIDRVAALVQAHPDRFGLARSAAEVRALKAEGKLALLLGMENGGPIEGDLANLEHFARRGVRYITLCHAKDNHICDSSYDARHTSSGLTDFGRQVVRRMNELGVLVDLSHVSDDSFWQALDLSRAPVICSHSSLRHFVPGFERDVSDEMVRAVGQNGGVVMINFGSTFLTAEANAHYAQREAARKEHAAASGADSEETRRLDRQWDAEHPFPFADVRDVADHVERVIRIAGVDHVGFGSDFDGVGPSLPTGLKDVSMYPNLIAELLRRGHSDDEIEKICGGNALRVLEACERIARELSAPAAR